MAVFVLLSRQDQGNAEAIIQLHIKESNSAPKGLYGSEDMCNRVYTSLIDRLLCIGAGTLSRQTQTFSIRKDSTAIYDLGHLSIRSYAEKSESRKLDVSTVNGRKLLGVQHERHKHEIGTNTETPGENIKDKDLSSPDAVSRPAKYHIEPVIETYSSSSKEVPIVVATTASESDLVSLLKMLSILRTSSGNTKMVVFDLGLSKMFKEMVASKDQNTEIRSFNHPHACRAGCKPQMVHSLLGAFSIIIWADIGHLPAWDMRLVLDEYPVGTSFVGQLSNKTINTPRHLYSFNTTENADLVSTNFFILFPHIRFYYRVLLPWVRCGIDESTHLCAAPIQAKGRIDMLNSYGRYIVSYTDALLSILLTDYIRLFPNSTLLSKAFPAPSYHAEPAHGNEDRVPVLPYVSNGLVLDRAFLAFVPMHGPNNQMSMIYDAAGLAWQTNTRVLVPPTAPHYVKNDRPGVTQEIAHILPGDQIFTAHFLYRNALLADPASSWAGLLPTVDFMIFEPLPHSVCPAPRNCSVGELMAAHGHLRRFFQNTGIAREVGATLNIVRCSSPSSARACLESAMNPGGGAGGGRRSTIAFWRSISKVHIGTCAENRHLKRSAPFALQSAMLVPGNAHQSPCLALQLRLHDTRCRFSACSVNNVPEARLADAPAFSVLMRPETPDTAAWRNLTVIGVVATVRDEAARAGLHLYALMPFHRALFNAVARLPNVSTSQNLDVAGRSDLEVLFLEMALAAGCDGGYVRDPRSSFSRTISLMRGGEGMLDARLKPVPGRKCLAPA
jgi:hypothetical protein